MIHFAYPLALLALLAVPLILALHLLQPKRRRTVLSTTKLWQAALEDSARGLGFRRLLANVSLMLLLASALALGLALAGPQWLTASGELGDTVLVLDVSASMKARSGHGTRFDNAIAEAATLIDRLPRGARMLVMTSGHKALLRTGFERDRGALHRILTQLRPTDEAGRPREALALAMSLLRGREHGRVQFVTDGAFDADVDPGSPRVMFRIVGGAARNVAITRFELRQEAAGDDHFQVLMTVRNFSDAPVIVPASASLEGRTLFTRSLAVKPHDEQTLVVRSDGHAAGRAIARIDIDDDLPADNQAFAVVATGRPVRVLLFTPGNVYLESALEALPGSSVVKAEWVPGADLARLASAYDVVVFDGIAAPRLPPGNFLLVNAIAPGLPFSDAGRVARPAILGRGKSALVSDVDLTAVRFEEARRVVTDAKVPELQRLFWSAETDLALALLDEHLKLVYLGFDLARSNFPRQLAFPLFFSHALEWLAARADGFVSSHVPAGSTYTASVPLPPSETKVTVRAPSGAAVMLEPKGRVLRFDGTADAGIYEYVVRDTAQPFAVSLTDARESDVNRRWVPAGRPNESRAVSNGAEVQAPLWPYLLALVFVLLTLEWSLRIWRRHRA